MKRNLMRVLAFCLSLALCAGLMPGTVWAAETMDSENSGASAALATASAAPGAEFAGGTGEFDDPYQVATAAQLDAVRNYYDAYFIQVADIDLSGMEWEPIGQYVEQDEGDEPDGTFFGFYDGNGFEIRNMTITSGNYDSVGLFGECALGTIIQNVNLTNINISIDKASTDYIEQAINGTGTFFQIGGIAGWGDTIRNCSVSGNISVVNCLAASLGGIGGGIGTTVENCINSANLYLLCNRLEEDINLLSSFWVCCGGITGEGDGTKISRCTNYGNVTATSSNFLYCGGISGIDGKIEYCVNKGNIKGTTNIGWHLGTYALQCNVGGIAGVDTSSIQHSANYGNVSSLAKANKLSCNDGTSCAGGIVGWGVWEKYGKVISCVNAGNTIQAKQRARNSTEVYDGSVGRIAGASNHIERCYSLPSTRCNGEIPYYVGADSIHGENLSEARLYALIATWYQTPDVPGPDDPEPRDLNFFFPKASFSIQPGELAYLNAYLSDGEGISSDDFVWTTSDDSVVSISDSFALIWDTASAIATVQGLKDGEADITLTIPDGRSITCHVTVLSPVPTVQFDEDVYRAEWFLTHSQSSGFRNEITMETPSQMYVRLLKGTSLEFALGIYDGLNIVFDVLGDITSVFDKIVERKDIYSAILFNALESSVDCDILDKRMTKAIKDGKSFASFITSGMKTAWNIDINSAYDLKKMTDAQKETLIDLSSDYFKKLHPIAATTKEVTGALSAALELYDNITDFYNYINNRILLNSVGDSLKQAVRELYRDSQSCSDLNLRAALRECKEIVDMSVDEMNQSIADLTLVTAGGLTAKYLIDEYVWSPINKSLTALHPGIAILQLVFKGEKMILNQLVNVDGIRSNYMQMNAISTVETLANQTYQRLGASFPQTKNQETARTLLRLVDVIYNLRIEDCDKVLGFIGAMDSGGINQLKAWLGFYNTDDLKAICKQIQDSYRSGHEQAQVLWVNSLEGSYPGSGLYEQYQYLLDHFQANQLTQTVTVACPVNVFVYNEADQLIASVEDGTVHSKGDVGAILSGEEKTFLFYDNDTYRIEVSATDDGTMDITVCGYQDSERTSTVNYNEIDLDVDAAFELNLAVGEDGTNIELNDLSEEETIEKDYDSRDDAGPEYTVTVESGLVLKNGVLDVSQRFAPGETVMIFADCSGAVSFTEWEVLEGDVSIKSPEAVWSSFKMPEENVRVRANVTLHPAILSVSIDGIVSPAEMPNSDFSIAIRLRMPENDASILLAAYDVTGRFLRLIPAAPQSAEGGVAVASAEITQTGEVADLRVFVVEDGNWAPLTASVSLSSP